MQATRKQARIVTLCAFLALVLVWGSFPVAAKIGVEHAPPLLLSGVRFLLAFLIMAGVALFQRKRLRIPWRHHLQVFAISTLMVGIPGSIFFAAAPYAPVSILTIMWSTTPIFTALFTVRESGEVRGWRLALSLGIGLLGVLIVLLGRLPFLPGTTLFADGGPALVGELAVLASAVVYALGIRAAKRGNPEMPVVILTTWQLFYSSVFLLAMSLIFEPGQRLSFDLPTVSVLLYLVIFCSCITFLLTFWLIRRIGAIRTAYADFLTPGVTLLLSYLFLGEDLALTKIAGLILVIFGVFLVEIE
jgi:drug/metabolite transporter (DMT)-like permease